MGVVFSHLLRRCLVKQTGSVWNKLRKNEGLRRGEIQIRGAQRAVLLFHFEKVTSHKWLSSGSGTEEKMNERSAGSRGISQRPLLARFLLLRYMRSSLEMKVGFWTRIQLSKLDDQGNATGI